MTKSNISSAFSLLFLPLALIALSGSNCDDVHRMAPNNDLHRAASSNDLDGIDDAMRRGIHIDTVDTHGNTALHFAASYGKVDAIRRLTERGADVNRKDRSGRTALHIAAPQGEGQIFYRKYAESIEVLVKAGAKINDKDGYGDTPLHRAAYWQIIENARLLRKLGASNTIRNNAGETAADQVRKKIDRAYESISRLEREGKHDLVQVYRDDISRYYQLLSAIES